jgi:hypothetical protein
MSENIGVKGGALPHLLCSRLRFLVVLRPAGLGVQI